MPLQQAASRNLLLSRLAADDFALLAPHLDWVDLPLGGIISDHDLKITHVHFLEEGVASITARSPAGQSAEIGIIGREGYVHPALILGGDKIPHRVGMQIPGCGHRISRVAFLAAAESSVTLKRTLCYFAQVNVVQTTFTALSNAVHPIDERLARWLLMCHDRSSSDDLQLTHEFMAIMLSVRRPSVTTALHRLEGEGLIRSERGYVFIRNRAGLESFASDAYGRPEQEYRELLGAFA